jgi:anti-sigma B factor antagonist
LARGGPLFWYQPCALSGLDTTILELASYPPEVAPLRLARQHSPASRSLIRQAYVIESAGIRAPLQDSALLIDIAGDIDIQTAPGATAFLTEATATSPRHLILDLSGVTFLASAGISLLMAAQSGGDGIRGQLHLLGVTDNLQVQRPLPLVGLLDRFDIAPDLHTLLARLDTIEPLAD